MYPELGTYSFLVDRPFVGRFPMASFSWFGIGWHDELFEDLQKTKSKFAVLPKKLPDHFEKFYFQVPANRKKYDQIFGYIEDYYRIVKTTPSLQIYQRE